MNHPNRLSRWVIKSAVAVVGIFSPKAAENAKRILFLSSFNAACVAASIMDQQTLSTLNKALCVTSNEKSLDVGFDMASTIWNEKDLKDLKNIIKTVDTEQSVKRFLSLQEAEIAVQQVLDKTPDWLKYDSKSMHYDVLDLFTENPVAF